MSHIILKPDRDRDSIITQMQHDASFDVADDDNACVPDFASIRNDVKSKPNPPKVPKIFLSNNCVFNCAYCGCRAGNDEKLCYTNDPKEMAEIGMQSVKNGQSGIFLTSAICKNADYTVELIVDTIKKLRTIYDYRGYIHAKIMPGADPMLIHQAGQYANRLSVNIEVAKSEGYSMIAKNKTRDNILTPMQHISGMIQASKAEQSPYKPIFATSQTTQIMAGAVGETDYELLRLTNAMYRKYKLARVYYTSYKYNHLAKGYDALPPTVTPVWRMKRLYQADRLMQLYGFSPAELLPEDAPNLVYDFDPKAAWVIKNIHKFPMEVNTAEYEELLKIPGIGLVYAERILRARKYCTITHDVLRQLGVSLKRSRHFFTANGKFQGVNLDDSMLVHNVLRAPLEETMSVNVSNSIEDC